MNYAKINTHDIANGPGVRVSLFVSGCTHHCKGCFNQETWDFSYGDKFDSNVVNSLLDAASHDYISGLTILGGEPFEIPNQQALLTFLQQFKHTYPEKDVWCYTGYTLESDILNVNGMVHSSTALNMLQYIDVLVDGEFKEDMKSLMLKFKGSSNQRIIDLPVTLQSGNIITIF